jgi:hypothetical protein
VKDAKIRDSRATNAVQGVFQPRREVGTKELIREVSEAREAEKVELEAIVDRLKQATACGARRCRDKKKLETLRYIN